MSWSVALPCNNHYTIDIEYYCLPALMFLADAVKALALLIEIAAVWV